jgi:hypothetical protein
VVRRCMFHWPAPLRQPNGVPTVLSDPVGIGPEMRLWRSTQAQRVVFGSGTGRSLGHSQRVDGWRCWRCRRREPGNCVSRRSTTTRATATLVSNVRRCLRRLRAQYRQRFVFCLLVNTAGWWSAALEEGKTGPAWPAAPGVADGRGEMEKPPLAASSRPLQLAPHPELGHPPLSSAASSSHSYN